MSKNRSEPPASPDADAAPRQLPATLNPLSFDPVPVRQRHDGLTPDRQRLFIEALADGLAVAAAAQRAGVSEKSVYRLRGRDDAHGFAAAWDAALADRLRQAAGMAFDRVLSGTVKRTFYHGQLVNEEVVHSERLLLWMLEKGQGLLGSDPAARARVARDWDAALAALEDAEEAACGGFRVWQDEDRVWLTNYPPPPGFDGYQEGAPGGPDYLRTLTDAEAESNAVRQQRQGKRAAEARDRFFAAGAAPRRPKRGGRK